MIIEDFDNIDNFTPDEKDLYGRPIIEDLDKIKLSLMTMIDHAVTLAKRDYGDRDGSFIVHCITRGAHAAKSKHYTGEAIDGHFHGLDLFQTMMIGWKAGFHGIGIYEWWQHPGVHLDIRKQKHVSTWFSTVQGEYNYTHREFVERALLWPEMNRLK
jgi:uncharacterized protein YcbK (DUF882 family)